MFGHIHEGYGITQQKNMKTKFINASSVTEAYKPENKPIIFFVEKRSPKN